MGAIDAKTGTNGGKTGARVLEGTPACVMGTNGGKMGEKRLGRVGRMEVGVIFAKNGRNCANAASIGRTNTKCFAWRQNPRDLGKNAFDGVKMRENENGVCVALK